MINLFAFASKDMSLTYLYSIFGSMNGVIQSWRADQPAGVSITLLGTMFKAFNTTVLAVGAFVVVYVAVIGVISTAHEGEFMGKKFNSVWVPIRTVLGIAALVPTASGFSGIQIIMMWVIVQGIGAADVLWNTTLGYIQVAGSPYAQVTIPSVGTSQIFTSLFQGLVCDANARATYASLANPNNPYATESSGTYFCATNASNGWCGGGVQYTPFSPDASSYALGPTSRSCGILQYCDRNASCQDATSLKCTACKQQGDALASIIDILGKLAVSFVKADHSYREFYAKSYNTKNNPDWQWIYSYCSAKGIPQNKCCVPTTNPIARIGQTCSPDATTFDNYPPNKSIGEDSWDKTNPSDSTVADIYWPYYPAFAPFLGKQNDIVGAAANEYTKQLTDSVNKVINDLMKTTSSTSTLTGKYADASSKGWIFAGSYYNTIAAEQANNLKDAIPSLTMVTKDPSIPSSENDMRDYRNDYAAAKILIDTASGNTNTGDPSSGGSQVMGQGADDTMKMFQNTLSSSTGTNALAGVTSMGNGFILAAEIMFLTLVAVNIAIAVIAGFTWTSLGTGPPTPPGQLPFFAMYALFVPAWLGAMGMFITYGGLLGIYVPLIPYMFFTTGAIGWLLSTIEAMVAGPLVALGILSPSAQGHELLGKAEPALALIFNIFLRPSLMIFGMMAAMLLSSVVVVMINSAFWGVANRLGGGIGILTPILELGAYTFFIVAALNKSFSAIFVIPQNVTRWMGGQAGEQYGEEQMAEAGKGGVEKAGEHAKAGTAEGTAGKEYASGKVKEAEGEVRRKQALADKAALKAKKNKPQNPST